MTGDRRPDWLRQKHSRQPVSPKLAAWADRTIATLAEDRQARHIGPFRDQARAQQAKNALYAGREGSRPPARPTTTIA